MTVLTSVDPLAYGMAPIRQVVLSGSGLPAALVDRLTSLTILNQRLSMPMELGVLLVFGSVFLVIGMRGFRMQG